MSEYVEDFRRAAHEAVEWVASYLENTRQYPVLPKVKPGDLTDALPHSGPERGESFDRIMKDFDQVIVPAVTHWNHPGFFGYFPSAASTPAIIAEMLAAVLNSNGIHWLSSPATVELEQVTLGWLREWMGLPENYFGIIYDTASVSSLHAIAAAREMADPGAHDNGAQPTLTLYCSEHAHSSIEKDCIGLGIGRRNVRKVPADAACRMDTGALARMIEADRASGRKPFCIVATIGTTSTTGIDPVPEIADIAEKQELWLHVDTAYAGAAAILPEMRQYFVGLDRADSIVLNPHKWLFIPMDLSAFYTRRPDVLRRAFSLVPEYLRSQENPRAINLMDYAIPLGRRFRALKLWFTLRYFGREGLMELLRGHIRLARELEGWIDADPRFERVAPGPFSLVCFRFKGTNEQNHALLEAINSTGKYFLSHTELGGKYVLRLAIGNLATTREDVRGAWELIRELAPRDAAGGAH
jgi:aromatic-L-amino-acid decarboxylase